MTTNNSPIVSIDPSSTITGYAVMLDAETLVSAGTFKPVARDGLAVKDMKPLQRIDQMLGDFHDLLVQTKPRTIVIEVTTGKAGTGSKRGAGPALAVYGMAVGAFWCHARTWCDPNDHRCVLEAVDERTWISVPDKDMRQLQIAAQFPAYRECMKKDRGADASDAIGIGLWWFGQNDYSRTITKGKL